MQSAGENARAFLLKPSNSIPNPSLSRMRVNYLPVFLTLCGSLAVVSPVSAQQTQIQYLSGSDKDNTVPWHFSISTGRNAGIATTIPVPSCWELQGFGNYQYGSGSSSNSETGFYTNTFAVPPAWAGKKIFLDRKSTRLNSSHANIS